MWWKICWRMGKWARATRAGNLYSPRWFEIRGWMFHKRHGQGTETRADGSKYVGEWKADNFHGEGTYTFPGGHKYVVEWKDGNRHGQGTLSFSSGEVRSGLWRNDYFVGKN